MLGLLLKTTCCAVTFMPVEELVAHDACCHGGRCAHHEPRHYNTVRARNLDVVHGWFSEVCFLL
jgi:hypothetical protein